MNGPLETRFQYSPKKRDEANRTTNLCKRSRRLRCVLHSYANPALSQLHVFFLTMRTTTNRKRPDHPPTSPETIGGLGPGQKPAPPLPTPPYMNGAPTTAQCAVHPWSEGRSVCVLR